MFGKTFSELHQGSAPIQLCRASSSQEGDQGWPGGCADLLNVFETFLPQLLLYPNPTDPLNGEAAALLMRHPKEYDAKVKGTSGIPLHLLVTYQG